MRSGRSWVLAAALLAAPAPALADAAGAARAVTLSISGGYRIFSHQLALQNDAALGARIGLKVVPRLQVALDYVLSDPLRKSTGKPASVSALRALVRFDALSGDTRAYLIAGAGGLLVNFTDSADYSTGALTAGVGVERRLAPNITLRLEGTSDLYRTEAVTYGPGGAEISRSTRVTNALGALAAGLGVEF